MRSSYNKNGEEVDDRTMAELASGVSSLALDSYSDFGVGAAVEVQIDTPHRTQYHVYQGININLSGMEYKLHAEQMAVFNALLDLRNADVEEYATLKRVVVHTTENDHSLVCGHCIQVLHGVCNHLDQLPVDVAYWGVRGKELYDGRGNPDGVHFTYRKENLGELIEKTYVHNREDN